MGPLDSHGCGVHQTVQTSPGDDGTLMTRKKQKSSKIVALNAQNMLFFLLFLLLLFLSLFLLLLFLLLFNVFFFYGCRGCGCSCSGPPTNSLSET